MTVPPIDPDITPESATEAFERALGNSNWRQLRDYARTGKIPPENLTGALTKAIKNGKKGTVEILIEAGADISKAPEDIAIRALRMRDKSLILTLLDKGADIHAMEDTLLIESMTMFQENMADMLLDRGADVNAQNGKALLIAIRRNLPGPFDRMLELGADPTLNDNAALSIAIREQNDYFYRTLMARDDIDITAGDNAALRAAIGARRWDYAAQLLELGADPTARDGGILLLAAKGGAVQGVKMLMEHDPAKMGRLARGATMAALEAKSKMPNQKTPHLDAVIEYLSPYALRHMLALKKLTARNRRTAP